MITRITYLKLLIARLGVQSLEFEYETEEFSMECNCCTNKQYDEQERKKHEKK